MPKVVMFRILVNSSLMMLRVMKSPSLHLIHHKQLDEYEIPKMEFIIKQEDQQQLYRFNFLQQTVLEVQSKVKLHLVLIQMLYQHPADKAEDKVEDARHDHLQVVKGLLSFLTLIYA